MDQNAGNTYHQMVSLLTKRLQSLVDDQVEGKKPHKYRLVSQAQAAPVERTLYLANKSGNLTQTSNTLNASDLRAAIYNQAAYAKQLEAFIYVSRTIIAELSQTAILGFKEGRISVPYMMLRSLIERIAIVETLNKAIAPLSTLTAPPDQPSKPLLELGHHITNALYGTRINWASVRSTDLRKAEKEAIKYEHKELSANLERKNILNSIDGLSKQVAGTRHAYELLCEFLHPNVGDLYAATILSSAFLDEHKTRHVTREIGIDPKNLSTSPDLEHALTQVLSICCDVLDHLPHLLASLQKTSAVATDMSTKFAHRVRKKYKPQFRARDLCPCLSGLRVRDCH